jgi:hypothetical protein
LLQTCAIVLSAATAAAVIGFLVVRLKSEFVGIRSIGSLLDTHRVLFLQAAAVVTMPWLLVPAAKTVQRLTRNPSP